MWIQKVAGGGVRALTYSPDGATLYTIDTSGRITAWDVAARTGQKIAQDNRLSYTSCRLYALADGKRLTTDGRQRTVWSVPEKRALSGTDVRSTGRSDLRLLRRPARDRRLESFDRPAATRAHRAGRPGADSGLRP